MRLRFLRYIIVAISVFSQLSCARPPGEPESPSTHSPHPLQNSSANSVKEGDLQLVQAAITKVELLTSVLEGESGKDQFSKHLTSLGQTFKDLSWNMKDPSNLRNIHGYRNRFEGKGNKRNTTGAQVDFEVLQHLSLVAESTWAQHLYTERASTLASLAVLKEKLLYAEASEGPQKDSELPVGHNKPIGILVKATAYVHDLECLRAMRIFLEEAFWRETRELDYTKAVHRFSLAYLFVQIGETAKELSDFIKPEGNGNGLRAFFKRIGDYRQFVKNDPNVVISSYTALLVWYNRLLIYTSDIMFIIGSLTESLESIITSESSALAVGKLDEVYEDENGITLPVPDTERRLSLAEVSEGLSNLDSFSEEGHQVQIDDLRRHINALRERGAELNFQLDVVQTRLREEASSPFARLQRTFTSRKSPLKQFLVLYGKHLPGLLKGAPDPLATPEAFEKELLRIRGEDRIGVEAKNIKALIGVFAKCRMANIRRAAIEFQESSGGEVPVHNIFELERFICESLDQGRLSLTERESELKRNNTKVRKELAVSSETLRRLEEELRLLHRHREREERKLSELVPIPSREKPSESAPFPLSGGQKQVENVLRVYAVLAAPEYQGSQGRIHDRTYAMAVGFLGEYYKRLFENDELMKAFFIERSPVATSMVSTKDLRNRRVMHNAKEFELHNATTAVQEQVKPWEREMLFLREYCAAYQLDIQTYLGVQSTQWKEEIEGRNYTSAERRVFLANITLCSLLRFVRPHIALEFLESHDGLEHVDGIRVDLHITHQILRARVYQQIGDADYLTRAIRVLNALEIEVERLDDGPDKDRFTATVKADKAQTLMLQGDFEEAAETTSQFLIEPDSEMGRMAHAVEMAAKVFSNSEISLTSFLGTSLKSLSNATYSEVFSHAQQLCAYYIMYGDYSRSASLVEFMKGILLRNDAHIKSVTGQGYEFIKGIASFANGTLLFNRGVSGRNRALIQQSVDEYEMVADYLERTQPGSEFSKNMWYRVARSLLFIETCPTKLDAAFARAGSFSADSEPEPEPSQEARLGKLIGKLLSYVYTQYIQTNHSIEMVRQHDQQLFDMVKRVEGQDLIGEMKIVIRQISSVYIEIAERFIELKQYKKARGALRCSSLASHIVRFADRIILESTQQASHDPWAQVEAALYAVAPLWKIPHEDLFARIWHFAQQRENPNSPLQLITGRLFPQGLSSTLMLVVSCFFEEDTSDDERRIVKTVTSKLMEQYEQLMPARGHLRSLGHDRTKALLDRCTTIRDLFQNPKNPFQVLQDGVQDIIELKRPSYWGAFWYVIEPELQLNERLRNPFRMWGLLCGAKFLAVLNSGIIHSNSSPHYIIRTLLNDSLERAVLSRIETSYTRIEHRDIMSLQPHIRHHVVNPMYDLRLQFLVLPPQRD